MMRLFVYVMSSSHICEALFEVMMGLQALGQHAVGGLLIS
jgi:hypothetical protein